MSAPTAPTLQCENCGAPAVPLRTGGAAFCPYCGAYHAAPEAAPTHEGVIVRERAADMPCPLCADQLVEAVVADHPAMCCRRCGGIMCAMGAFALIVQARRAEFRGAELAPTLLNADELRRSVRCPRCRKTMSTHPYHGPGNIVIDVCTACRLVWLDRGELTVLERAPGKR